MTGPDPVVAFDQHKHDHRDCVAAALATAERVCTREGLRLTSIRRRVLELVWTHRGPVGAYQLLDSLAAERGRVAPPTVYRALDFLLAHGLVHRIESLNAFVGCARPREPHAGYFLICRICGAAAELEDTRLSAALHRSAERLGFALEQQTVELRGLCPACIEGASAGASVAR